MTTPDTSVKVASVHWPIPLLIAIVGGLIFWFGMLFPLMPKTTTGWIVAIASGVLVGQWAVGSALLIGWLQRQVRFKLLCKIIGGLLAITLGAGIFWLALKGQSFVVQNFSYFGR